MFILEFEFEFNISFYLFYLVLLVGAVVMSKICWRVDFTWWSLFIAYDFLVSPLFTFFFYFLCTALLEADRWLSFEDCRLFYNLSLVLPLLLLASYLPEFRSSRFGASFKLDGSYNFCAEISSLSLISLLLYELLSCSSFETSYLWLFYSSAACF